MYDLNNYPDIIFGLKKLSNIYKDMSNGWIQILCPYCNDSTRKSHISHGHFYIAKSFNYCHCFRCEHSSTFTNFLKDLGFNDPSILKELSKQTGNIVFSNTKSRIVIQKNIRDIIIEIFNSIYIEYIKQFLNYIQIRCLIIDPIKFLLFPNIINNKVNCGFYNYNGVNIGYRIIEDSDIRYVKNNVTDYYFFQDINEIIKYKDIVICEGVFDLINLYNFSPYFNNKNSFYIAINGRDYKKIVKELILNYLLIGSYRINIIFDNGIANIDKIRYFHNMNAKQLNTKIEFKYFKPIVSKDVSDIMNIQKLD
jgi:hypothetical protein